MIEIHFYSRGDRDPDIEWQVAEGAIGGKYRSISIQNSSRERTTSSPSPP